MRLNYYVIFIGFILGPSGFSASAFGGDFLSTPYSSCFRALETRISKYCNCQVINNDFLVLTSHTGLRAKVGIDKTINGLPEVAWVLNQVNRSGHPGNMKSYTEKSRQGQQLWVIEENIRQWDLKPSKDGLKMSKPLKISRSFKFSLEKGSCEFASANLVFETKEQKQQHKIDKSSCDRLANSRDIASETENYKSEIKKECEGVYQLLNAGV